jgi:hypothetical protein
LHKNTAASRKLQAASNTPLRAKRENSLKLKAQSPKLKAEYSYTLHANPQSNETVARL